LAALPNGVNWRHMVGVGFLAGIGFTVSLFITDLAFTGEEAVIANAKIAILVASVLASVGGAAMMLTSPSGVVAGVDSDAAEAVADPDRPSADLGPMTYDELEATAPDSFLANGTSSNHSAEHENSSSS
ncbi:MAG: Na+/H+ antiporter NhaA, partial [Actinomycetota bacterium]